MAPDPKGRTKANLVRAKGLEPPHLSIPEPKSGASTSFATPAKAGWGGAIARVTRRAREAGEAYCDRKPPIRLNYLRIEKSNTRAIILPAAAIPRPPPETEYKKPYSPEVRSVDGVTRKTPGAT